MSIFSVPSEAPFKSQLETERFRRVGFVIKSKDTHPVLYDLSTSVSALWRRLRLNWPYSSSFQQWLRLDRLDSLVSAFETAIGCPTQTLNPYNQGSSGRAGAGAGGCTLGQGDTGRTPNPYNDSHTPTRSANSRTPNLYVEHGKTLMWDAPHGHPIRTIRGGGKSSRTPNSYVSGANNGGASTWGGVTPGQPVGLGWDAWDPAPTPYAAAFTPRALTPATYSAIQTPSAYKYQTLAQTSSYPQTLGVTGGGSYGTIRSPLRATKQNFPRVIFEVAVGARAHQQGVVLSVLDMQNDLFVSTARVHFLEVLVSDLQLVHPECKGKDVIMLGTS
ncbi:hypothetical protein GSI_08357 [Ganoderma sinense ZZ0214-1]|uniref:Uncharacterized protein n=1 Tax=Ganoderma sinense ZZ0214-1 TaxID=1077348 RepID=A0A2G8S6Z4_9APHY|nr:hypothetical protein GSI_08357 [Ganoderma sinense ZZ0214-1]